MLYHSLLFLLPEDILIRLLLIAFALFFYLLFGFLLLPVIWISGLFSKKPTDKIAHFYLTTACRLGIFLSGCRLHISGLENIPEDRPAVFVINHRSIFDILTVYTFLKKPTGFIAKNSLGKIPLFSYWVKLGNGLFLNRENVREGMKTILTAIDKVKRGISICIFPEGTRNRDKTKTTLLPFHGGSFKVATKAKAPVVPIVLYNTSAAFEDHFPKISAEDIYIKILPLTETENLTRAEERALPEEIQNAMQNELILLEEEAK